MQKNKKQGALNENLLFKKNKDDEEIIARINDKEANYFELFLLLNTLSKEQFFEMFGKEVPEVEILGESDDDLEKAKQVSIAAFEALYKELL